MTNEISIYSSFLHHQEPQATSVTWNNHCDVSVASTSSVLFVPCVVEQIFGLKLNAFCLIGYVVFLLWRPHSHQGIKLSNSHAETSGNHVVAMCTCHLVCPQGYVVGYIGSKIFCLYASSMHTVDVPQVMQASCTG